MKARHKRLSFILIGMVVLAITTGLILNAVNSNMVFFYSPSQVHAGEVTKDHVFRLGGLVVEESLKRRNDGLTVNFQVTDNAKTVPVKFVGLLPDLFREGQGVVAQGRLNESGVFVASEVLAKHDETYMPTEVMDALEQAKKSSL
ncbi:MAG: cytochrome c maturation protein CcmE [Ectothiorhodospiraceae bacterium]|nr:cytochrome c maturation protein CcmE [Ectothiorhodospiraceae bacterium]